ncbi:sugar ABC transporter substrate-binding protein [Bacillus timonensis]|uniref:Sugar ABC transporter substrate-binding protein n=1 Tax=Bacillus timonensis TaxID=1033734 RepID=A0A4S3PUJ6_9BACI|nr:substrate-binding domain-containing protein [Bacillus timonensis]THE13467.1 sugar ABC transporter substrate-binding protein [Bacillus timonensis]
MKKVKGIAFVLLMFLGILSGCAGNTEEKVSGAAEGKVKIGVLYQNLQNEYIVNLQDSIRKYAESAGAELIESDGEGKAENQVSQVENLINQQVDAIILNPADKDGSAAVAEKAAAANIPIITVLATVSNIDKLTAHVGSDDVEAGIIEMKHAAELLEGKGTIGIIRGPNGNSAEVNRTAGIMEVLKDYPDIEIAADQTANFSREEALSLTENWLQSQELDAIIAQNDEMALGAIKAISAAGKLNEIKVLGIDAIPDALNSIEAGELAATVFQDVDAQGKMAVDVAFKAAKGESVEKDNMIPFQLVTKENLNQFK